MRLAYVWAMVSPCSVTQRIAAQRAVRQGLEEAVGGAGAAADGAAAAVEEAHVHPGLIGGPGEQVLGAVQAFGWRGLARMPPPLQESL
jgi:hypothetical protein